MKRRNYSPHTVKSYMKILKSFVLWVDVPIERVEHGKVGAYVDHLLGKRLKPKSINFHLACIRIFYNYLYHEEGIKITNPVKRGSALRMPKPLPKHLRDEEVIALFDVITYDAKLSIVTAPAIIYLLPNTLGFIFIIGCHCC